MHIDIIARPAGSAARITLDAEETLRCEVGGMIAMTDGLDVHTTAHSRAGGLLRGLRRMLAQESFFLNEFTARADGQELLIGPTLMGDIVHHRLDGQSLIVQGGSWLASSGDIRIDATWQGLGAALWSGESMFWVHCQGTGDLLLNSYGGIYEVQLRDDYMVDTGHIVAFEDTLKFRVGKSMGGWVSSFLSGEGLVCKFSGQGKLWCQTHDARAFGQAIGRRLKPREA
jgi:uncharacterized protein (TIGR00266 family)